MDLKFGAQSVLNVPVVALSRSFTIAQYSNTNIQTKKNCDCCQGNAQKSASKAEYFFLAFELYRVAFS